MQYTIPENNHRSGIHFYPFINRNKMQGAFKFHENCLYEPGYSQDINKLVGFSFLHHHYQSTRIGWRTHLDGKRIELFLYTYNNFQMAFKKLGLVYPEKEYKFTLQPNKAMIYGNNLDYTSMDYRDYTHPYLGYVLYPYYGGNLVAPHRMDIDLDFHLKKA